MRTLLLATFAVCLLFARLDAATTTKWFSSYGVAGNTGGARFFVIQGFNGSGASSETFAYAPMCGAGTIQALSASSSAVPGGIATWTIALSKELSVSALICTIASAATSCSDGSDQISVVQGDRVSIKVTPSASAPAAANISWSLSFVSTDATTCFEGNPTGAGGNLSTTVTQYSSIHGTNLATSLNFQRATFIAETGMLGSFCTYLTTAAGAGASRTFTLNINAIDTSITTSYTGAGTGVGINGNACTTANIPVYAGDKIAVESTLSGAAASAVGVSLAFKPNTAGHFPIPGITGGNLSNSAVNYANLSGNVAPNATETSVQTYSSADYSIAGIMFYLASQPGLAKSYALKLRANAGDASTTFLTTLTNAQVYAVTTGTFTPSSGDLLDIISTPTGTPTASAVGFTLIGSTTSSDTGAGVTPNTSALLIVPTGTAASAISTNNLNNSLNPSDVGKVTNTNYDGCTWTNGSATAFTVTNTDLGLLLASQTIRTTAYTGGSNTQGFAYNNLTNPAETIKCLFITPRDAVSVGFLLNTSIATSGGTVGHDFLVINGTDGTTTYGCVAQWERGTGATYGLLAHWATGSSDGGSTVALSANTTYWVTLMADGTTNKLCQLKVFSSAGALIGTSSKPVDTSGYTMNGITFGNNPHTDFATGTTVFKNILVDMDAKFPLGVTSGTGFFFSSGDKRWQ